MDVLIYEQEGRPVPVPGLFRLQSNARTDCFENAFQIESLSPDRQLVVAVILWSWNDKVARLEDDDR